MQTAALAAAIGITPPLHAQDSKVIASAGKATITQPEIDALVRSLDAPAREKLAANPAGLKPWLGDRLAQRQLMAEAQAKNWAQRPEVDAAIRSAAQEIVLRSYLASVSAPVADYPSEAEVQAAYDKNRESFALPQMYRLSQIFIDQPTPAAAAASKAKAEDVARQAKAAGADFAALAKAHSQEPASAARGGDTGWVAAAQMLPQLRETVGKMKPGEVAGPVQTPNGFHIVMLSDQRAPGVRPLAEVREELKAALRQQRQTEQARAYLARLADPKAMTVDETALSAAIRNVK